MNYCDGYEDRDRLKKGREERRGDNKRKCKKEIFIAVTI